MRARIAYFKELITTSFWFVPALMMTGAVILAAAMATLPGTRYGGWLEFLGFDYQIGADGARSVLSTIATSIITVVSLVVSLTLVALTLASQQLGPRLLRTFMRDRSTQVVLGSFLATAAYTLLILPTVRGSDESTVVPTSAILIAVVLTLVSLCLLIYFVHHIAMQIQADTVVSDVGNDLEESIDRFFPPWTGAEPTADSAIPPPPEAALPLPAMRSGYIQTIDLTGLLDTAQQDDLTVRLLKRPGDFVIAETTVAQIWATQAKTVSALKAVDGSLLLGDRRTPTQDVSFSVMCLAEVALRALSPGINDPHTAVASIDRLTSGLAHVLRRDPSPEVLTDRSGIPRIYRVTVTFSDLLDTALEEILHFARDNGVVLRRVQTSLQSLDDVATRPTDKEAISRYRRVVDRLLEHGDARTDSPQITG